MRIIIVWVLCLLPNLVWNNALTGIAEASPKPATCLGSGTVHSASSSLLPPPQWECTIRSALDGQVPGYSWIVLQNGQVVDSLSVGFARAPWETAYPAVPMTTQTPIFLGAFSKLITATAILQLVQDNLSRLDQPFWNVISDHPQITAELSGQVARVTVGELLAETTGMLVTEDIFQPYWTELNKTLDNSFALFSTYKDSKSIHYAILQLIVEIWSGQSYSAYVEDHIFAPLNVTDFKLTLGGFPSFLVYQNSLFSYPEGVYWDEIPFAPGSYGWVGTIRSAGKLLSGLKSGTLLNPVARDWLYSERSALIPYEGNSGLYLHLSYDLSVGSNSFNRKGFSSSYFQFSDGYEAFLWTNSTDHDLDELLIEAFESDCSVCAIAGNGLQLGCQDQNIALSAQVSGGNGLTYEWLAGSGEILSGKHTLNPIVKSPGSYTLIATDPVSGCTARSSILIAPGSSTVNFPEIPLPDQLDCQNEQIILNPGYEQDADLSFFWTTHIGRILSGAGTPSPIVDAPGIYYGTVIDTENNCSDTRAFVVNSNREIPRIELPDRGYINCRFDPIVLAPVGTDTGDEFKYTWNTITGNIVGPNDAFQVTIDKIGRYTLTVQNTQTNCENKADIIVVTGPRTLETKPRVEICPGEEYMGYSTTTIVRDTTFLENECLITLTPLVVLSENDSRCEMTASSNVEEKNELRIFPNPTAGSVQIEHLPAFLKHYYLLDVNGRSVQKGSLPATGPARLDLSALASGIYFLQLEGLNGQFLTKKLVKL